MDKKISPPLVSHKSVASNLLMFVVLNNVVYIKNRKPFYILMPGKLHY